MTKKEKKKQAREKVKQKDILKTEAEKIELEIKPIIKLVEKPDIVESIVKPMESTTTEKLNKAIHESAKPKKQIKVKYPNGHECMMNIEIAKRLEKKDGFKVIV